MSHATEEMPTIQVVYKVPQAMFPKTESLSPYWYISLSPILNLNPTPEKKYSMIDMNYDGFIYLLGLLLAGVLPAEKIIHFCQVVGVLGDSIGGTGRSIVALSVNNMTEVAHLRAVSTRVDSILGLTYVIIHLRLNNPPRLESLQQVNLFGDFLCATVDLDGEQTGGQPASVREQGDPLPEKILRFNVREEGNEPRINTGSVHVTAHGRSGQGRLYAVLKPLFGETHKCFLDATVRQ